jgi:hypothetical protein
MSEESPSLKERHRVGMSVEDTGSNSRETKIGLVEEAAALV